MIPTGIKQEGKRNFFFLKPLYFRVFVEGLVWWHRGAITYTAPTCTFSIGLPESWDAWWLAVSHPISTLSWYPGRGKSSGREGGLLVPLDLMATLNYRYCFLDQMWNGCQSVHPISFVQTLRALNLFIATSSISSCSNYMYIRAYSFAHLMKIRYFCIWICQWITWLEFHLATMHYCLLEY